MQPTMGRIVQFFDFIRQTASPAIVRRAHDDGAADLTVFGDDGERRPERTPHWQATDYDLQHAAVAWRDWNNARDAALFAGKDVPPQPVVPRQAWRWPAQVRDVIDVSHDEASLGSAAVRQRLESLDAAEKAGHEAAVRGEDRGALRTFPDEGHAIAWLRGYDNAKARQPHEPASLQADLDRATQAQQDTRLAAEERQHDRAPGVQQNEPGADDQPGDPGLGDPDKPIV